MLTRVMATTMRCFLAISSGRQTHAIVCGPIFDAILPPQWLEQQRTINRYGARIMCMSQWCSFGRPFMVHIARTTSVSFLIVIQLLWVKAVDELVYSYTIPSLFETSSQLHRGADASMGYSYFNTFFFFVCV